MNEINLTQELLETGESMRVEFVDSPSALESIARSVCAMLNSKGGVVLAGIDEQGRATGQASEQDAKAVRRYLHEHITPRVLFTVSLDEVPGGSVVAVDVPEGRDRPYVVEGAIYVRAGAQTRPADAETIRAMVDSRARETERWERRAASGLEVGDLDLDLLNETVRRGQDRRGYRFQDPNNPEAVLADLALSRFGQLTNAADVLFGRQVALRHPQTRMRAVRYATHKGDDFVDEQLFEGPAFALLEEGIMFLKRHVSIAAEFKTGQLSRESRPEYSFFSFREGLVNALVHRDYASFAGGVSVSMYPDRVEIWNSGRLPKGLSPKRLREPSHDSILVNPDISHVFYLHELMERVGRGTFKIVEECRQLGSPPPEWQNVASGVRLTLYAATGPHRPALNHRQEALLKALAPGEAIQTQAFLDRFGKGVGARQARRDLGELEGAGFLKRMGAGPTTAYQRTEKEP